MHVVRSEDPGQAILRVLPIRGPRLNKTPSVKAPETPCTTPEAMRSPWKPKRSVIQPPALSVLLLGPKEYYALARLHAHISDDKLNNIIKEFVGDIYQRPPQRSSVRRATRIRTIYELEVVEQFDRLLLMRTVCQAGTYIRKIIYDIGEILSPGATMIELRRTRVSNFCENNDNFTRLHDLSDAIQVYREKKDETNLGKL